LLRFPKQIPKELGHILHLSHQINIKPEGTLDFDFLPLLAAFLGVEEVVSDDILDTQTHVCDVVCKLILVIN